jgi:hypothetical protein
MSLWSDRKLAGIRTNWFHDLNYPPNIITITNSNRMERQDGKHAWKNAYRILDRKLQMRSHKGPSSMCQDNIKMSQNKRSEIMEWI